MSTITAPRNLKAVLWDFDGTLADTRGQNLRVTRRVVERVTRRRADDFTVLRSPREYGLATMRAANWRELYLLELGLTDTETDEAGRLWSSYQLADAGRPACYRGISTVLRQLRNIPHGIVSQNARSFIESVLERENLVEYFQAIVGHEEVASSRQKPAPDGLLLCLEETAGFSPGCVLYVGDHASDAACAANANAELQHRGLAVTVLMVSAIYGDGSAAAEWAAKADYRARDPRDILKIAEDQL